MNDFIRSFFGLPTRNYDEFEPRSFGFNRAFDESDNMTSESDVIFGNLDNMFRNFDQMCKEFDSMFNGANIGIGQNQFPELPNGALSDENENLSPRDHMLKPEGHENRSPKTIIPKDDSIWNIPENPSDTKQDSDLDGKINKENFADIWSQTQQDRHMTEKQPQTMNPIFSFSYYSRTTTGSNVEEETIIRTNDGEKHIVKRQTGDGIYQMEKETKPDGSVNVIENNTASEKILPIDDKEPLFGSLFNFFKSQTCKENDMNSNGIGNIEEKIRSITLTKRIRPNELFLDYDKLRSGFVTDSQFFRVLWQNVGIKLAAEEEEILKDYYGRGNFNYREFCKNIEKRVDPNRMDVNPNNQVYDYPEYLGNRTIIPQDQATEENLRLLLMKLGKFYKYRGINLRTECEDFDTHHRGLINFSQFYRSIPKPPEVNESDMADLINKYRDPAQHGLINYLNLHRDIEDLQANFEPEGLNRVNQPADSAFKVHTKEDKSLQEIFDRIRIAVHKHRVRTPEFFKDYDPLRSGVITEQQFICGLSLAIGSEAQLSRGDMQKVVEFYKRCDGRVGYKEFVDVLENVFNEPDLEKKPLLTVHRPPTGALGRNLPQLSGEEERRVLHVLEEISEKVRQRRIMMFQYFRDFDRSTAFTRVMTPNQFSRMLHFLSLNVSAEDFKLLCRKFADPTTGDINYPGFVQAVDQDFVNYAQGTEKPEVWEMADSVKPKVDNSIDTSKVDMEMLLALIRNHVHSNSRRIEQCFADYDQLRSGSISKSRFRRGLSDLGLSSIGTINLSPAQFEALANRYRDSDNPEMIKWTLFAAEIDPPGMEKQLLPKPGTINMQTASADHQKCYQEAMQKLHDRVDHRRVLLKPIFQDFDRHNRGHVNKRQFRQALSMGELALTEAEIVAIEACYCNDDGFNYKAFLSDLEPQPELELRYLQRLADIRLANDKAKLPEINPGRDLECIFEKIKRKVFKERVRIHEWMRDYDKLRHGCIHRTNFRRALDLCRFELTESELAIVEDHYAAAKPNHIEWERFSRDVEQIFTVDHLEKQPLRSVEQYRPSENLERKLPKEHYQTVKNILDRIAKEVKQRRIQLYPLFEDYDKVHNGTVTRNQFRRVLNELQLAGTVSSEFEWNTLLDAFNAKIANIYDNVNYATFCDTIYDLCGFEFRKP
ncbi:DgyrCDS10796 [Dimorphilus gyrociliatus]|uniref:DgyrCDS10796 n=1 Tax=Dimorphilus gyrociliatus TaxID=2664684 RepID=A0A7I8W3A1_9ANNE|nr:DgyrCDS10796 [Dimorphilus gyrociliatus]